MAAAAVLGLFGWIVSRVPTAGRPDPIDQNYNLLVRGFQSGQLNLKKEIPPGFAQLADPWDPLANRAYRGPRYGLHDLTYFRGKLFLYFGATPAILLFWPCAALTGHYLSQESAVAVFCGVGFLAGAGLLLGLWRRYFPQVSAGVATAGVAALGLASGMPIILQRPEFYEVATSCGTALTMLALAGVWLAVEQPERRGRWLAAASLAYGLAVGARPSVLFGAVILLIPVVLSSRERIEAGAPYRFWRLLAIAMLPLSLCGLALMLYNGLRFGNPFQFGQRFQLQGERTEHLRFFNVGYLWFNFRVYFLEPVQWTRHFPFAGNIASLLPPPGHATIESGGGVLANMPLLWLSLAAPLAWRARPAPERGVLRALIGSATLHFGLSALVLCLLLGNTWRYEVEFLPAFTLVSIIGIFGLERALADRPLGRMAARAGWSLLLAGSIAFNAFESIHSHAEQIELSALRLTVAGKSTEGIAEFGRALSLDPNYTEAYLNRANTCLAKGDFDQAAADFNRVIRLDPSSAVAFNNLAWLCAACSEERIRNGVKAVAYAEKACELTEWKNADDVDTLAAACAEAGEFASAVKWETKYLETKHSQEATDSARDRLSLYAAGEAVPRRAETKLMRTLTIYSKGSCILTDMMNAHAPAFRQLHLLVLPLDSGPGQGEPV